MSGGDFEHVLFRLFTCVDLSLQSQGMQPYPKPGFTAYSRVLMFVTPTCRLADCVSGESKDISVSWFGSTCLDHRFTSKVDLVTGLYAGRPAVLSDRMTTVADIKVG